MVPLSSGCQKLLERARTNPVGLRFRELVRLAECFGFTPHRQKGSHIVLVAEGVRRPLVVQDVGGHAKPYQVRELLKVIETMEAEG